MADQPDEGLVVVTTTVGTRADADALAAAMVGRRLAACVHACEIVSTYRWEGEVRTEREWRLDAKTTASRAEAAMAALAEAHPYDEPELIVTAVAAASEGYGGWVRRAVA